MLVVSSVSETILHVTLSMILDGIKWMIVKYALSRTSDVRSYSVNERYELLGQKTGLMDYWLAPFDLIR